MITFMNPFSIPMTKGLVDERLVNDPTHFTPYAIAG